MATVFFFSGFSSLVYEVIWMRRLALFFGSDVYSAALTLSAFMGGLTLGSLLAARYVDRLRRLLVWYGLLEILIGIYALIFPSFPQPVLRPVPLRLPDASLTLPPGATTDSAFWWPRSPC